MRSKPKVIEAVVASRAALEVVRLVVVAVVGVVVLAVVAPAVLVVAPAG